MLIFSTMLREFFMCFINNVDRCLKRYIQVVSYNPCVSVIGVKSILGFIPFLTAMPIVARCTLQWPQSLCVCYFFLPFSISVGSLNIDNGKSPIWRQQPKYLSPNMVFVLSHQNKFFSHQNKGRLQIPLCGFCP